MIRFRSIRDRVAAWFVGFSFAILVAAFATYYVYGRDVLVELTDHDLEARATSIVRFADRTGGTVSFRRSVRRAPSLSSSTPFRGWVAKLADGTRTVIASESMQSGPVSLSELLSIPCPGERTKTSFVAASGASLRVLCVHPRESAGIDEVIVVDGLERVDEELRELARGFAIALLPAMICAFACAWLAARRIAGPVRAIADAADHVDGGGDPARFPAAGVDEVGRLAVVLRRAFGRIQDAIRRERSFTTDASHELRTPVAAILTEAEVALRAARSPAEHEAVLHRIVAASRRMQSTLDALLLLARFDSRAPASRAPTSDVPEAVAAAVDAVRILASERRVSIDTSGADGPLPRAVADPDLLTVAIRNLVANAVEHGREGGNVTVVAREDGGDVVVEVTDDGPGLPRAGGAIRADRPVRGVGLTLVHRILGLFGASVDLRSLRPTPGDPADADRGSPQPSLAGAGSPGSRPDEASRHTSPASPGAESVRADPAAGAASSAAGTRATVRLRRAAAEASVRDLS